MTAEIIDLCEFDELCHEELERQIAFSNVMACVCWQLTEVSNDNAK